MYSKNTILVTGGSGFIGSNLVDLFIKEGHLVVVIDNLSTGQVSNHNMAVKYINEDICTYVDYPDKLVAILEKYHVDTVYHLAANTNLCASVNNPERVYKINLLASIALAQVCKNTGVKKLVFASTSAVFGEPKYRPVDEEHDTKPTNPYGHTKLCFEEYLDYLSSETDMIITIFRLPNVYGPRQRPDLDGGVVSIFYNLMCQGLPVRIFGDGQQTRDWVYVDDITNALYRALKHHEKFNIFLLGSEIETSVNKLFQYSASITGYAKDAQYVGVRVGDVNNMVASFRKANAILGWTPLVSLPHGIAKLTKEN